MNNELIIVLVLGVILMNLLVIFQMKWYSVALWKCIPITIMLAITGVIGSRIWYFIENGSFMGRSLYGAIFFAPLVYFPLSKIFRISYLESLDFCAPAGCLTLALVKIQCLRDGCCMGKALYVDENHFYVFFPSQIVEMVVFLIISGVLLYMSYRPQFRKKIFPWFLVIYGGARFILSFLRENTQPYALGLNAGSFWSLIVIIAGALWLYIAYKVQKKKISINVN